MRDEILRMEHIRWDQSGQGALNYLSLQVFSGEIFGVLALEQSGIDLMVERIIRNLPISQGRVYFQERLVNAPGMGEGAENNAALIGPVSNLFPDLSIADNLFTTRAFFRRFLIPEKTLRRDTNNYLKEMHLSATADTPAGELSEYERILIEIKSAMLSGRHLLVLWDAFRRLSSFELEQLGSLLRRWSQEGWTFLVIYNHHEVLRTLCDRIAIFKGGAIQKTVADPRQLNRLATGVFAQPAYDRLQILSERANQPERTADTASEPVLHASHLKGPDLEKIRFSVSPGEILLFSCRNTDVADALSLQLFLRQDAKDQVLIPRDPIHTLLFPELSALENFCLPFGEQVTGFWQKKSLQRSVRSEYDPLLGDTLDAPDLYRLSPRQLYDLLYLRYLLSHPRLLICVQPLQETDMHLRTHILGLLLRLKEHGIAVLILGTELYDTIYIADRLLQQRPDGEIDAYQRGDFANLRLQEGSFYPD